MDTITLPAHVCAEIALHMHHEYRKAMHQHINRTLSFEEWLHRIVEKSQADQEKAA
jgi:hypothetical protein